MPSDTPRRTRPIVASISAAALRHNYSALRAAAGMETLAVVKADAYGHGAALCAPELVAAGARWLGVTSVDEGIAVRHALRGAAADIPTHILVMCGLWQGEAGACLDHALTPVVWEPYQLHLLQAEGERRALPSGSVPVHVEIDTGMARQGVKPGAALHDLLTCLQTTPVLRVDGAMTHLASSECAADPQNTTQMDRFRQALEQVQRAGLRPAWVHAGNSASLDSGLMPHALPALAATLGTRPMTRTGVALYGYALPLESAAPHVEPHLRPVLTWTTRIVSLRDVAAGSTVGYNAAFVAPRPMRLALLPVGYADGFRRALSSSTHQPGGAVLIGGRRAPVVGRVSMDLTVVDVSDLPDAAIGDEAVLIGSQGAEHIGADEHARLANTSMYEVLCGISDRVPRVLS